MRTTYSNDDLALAYELHHEGCGWKLIALCLGMEWETLRSAVYQAMREGLRK
jgi:hypothetical protein